ncbi:TolB family protein [Kitasatospora sp. NPDC004240]
MADESWGTTPDSLKERRIGRARFMAQLTAPDGTGTLVAQDADGGELVRVADVPGGAAARPLALSWDGTRALVRTGPAERPDRDLVLFTLATGERHSHDATAEGGTEFAALSPDGRTLATLTGDDVRVGVLDLATGARRRIWSAPGWATVEASVSWSPDGRLIAATYVSEEDVAATIVLSAEDGAEVAHYEGLLTVASPNGTWSGPRELLLLEEDPEEPVAPVLLRDVTSGATRRFDRDPQDAGGLHALAGGRLVELRPGDGLYAHLLDGSDPRPVLGPGPGYTVGFFDISEAF